MIPPGARLREYVPADRGQCLAIFDSNVPHFFRSGERAGFEGFLDALPGPYFVLLDAQDVVVGCGGYAVRARSRTADLCWGMARRDRHGEGFGRALVELRVRRIVTDHGVADIALNTSQHTASFYERLGFQTMSIEPDGYAPGLDRVEMVLSLEAR